MFRILWLFMFAAAGLIADEPEIKQLLPGFPYPLAVTLALPSDFVSVKEPNSFHGYIWARKDDIDEILKNPEKPVKPFFLASISPNITQEGTNEFSGEENFENELKASGFSDIKVKKVFWGTYPVLGMKAIDKEGRAHYSLWIGLNTEPVEGGPKPGLVLVVNYFYPEGQKKPSEEELVVLRSLLNDTKPLPEKETLALEGYDIQDNFTLFTRDKVKIKVMAQQRGKDLVVLSAPLSPNTEMVVKGVRVAPLALEWRHGRPSVKVFGEALYTDGNEFDVVPANIPALINEVEEFTEEFQELRAREGTYVSFP